LEHTEHTVTAIVTKSTVMTNQPTAICALNTFMRMRVPMFVDQREIDLIPLVALCLVLS
jgi:hypothetical protein